MGLEDVNKILEKEDDLHLLRVKMGFDIDVDRENDPEFPKFLISMATNLILMKNDLSEDEIEFLYDCMYTSVELKYDQDGSVYNDVYRTKSKYLRDMKTLRGLINVCARETKNFCCCMEDKKLEADKMEKNGRCFGCLKVFPKKRLEYCSGCLECQYCCKQCQKDDWSRGHKDTCGNFNFVRCGECNILLTATQLSQHNCRNHNK